MLQQCIWREVLDGILIQFLEGKVHLVGQNCDYLLSIRVQFQSHCFMM